jgi:hypothetical protein
MHREAALSCLGHLDLSHSILPFDFAQGGESFDSAQDRELVERPVEPFRISDFVLRISFIKAGTSSFYA